MSCKTLAVLLLFLFLACACLSAYLFVDRQMQIDGLVTNSQIRARYMDAYDQLVCDMICGRSIDDANDMLSPHKITMFKERQDYAHLKVGSAIIDIYVKGGVIVDVESSPFAPDVNSETEN